MALRARSTSQCASTQCCDDRQYDFTNGTLRKTEDIPPFLLPLRELAAGFAGISRMNYSTFL